MNLQRLANQINFYCSPFKPLLLSKLIQASFLRRGEIAKTVDISLDTRCNMKCQHCSSESLKSNEPAMTVSDYREFAKELDRAEVVRVNITGGEPLLRKDFDSIVTELKPNRRHIKLQTNGVLLDRNRIVALKRLGVNAITISLDTMDANEYAAFRGVGPDCHAKILRNISLVRDCGLQISVSAVLTHQNLRSDAVGQIIEYASKSKITLLANIATASGRWQARPDYLFDAADRAFLQGLQQRFPHVRTDHDAIGCPAVVRKIYITPQGEVLPCPFIHISYGNVRQQSLTEILCKMTRHYPFSRMPVCPAAEGAAFLENWYPHIGNASRLPLPVEQLVAQQRPSVEPNSYCAGKDDRKDSYASR